MRCRSVWRFAAASPTKALQKTGLAVLSLCWLAATVWWWLQAEVPQLAAAPHTISPIDHPFDPDWPDVYLILVTKCTGCHRPGTDQTDLTSYQAVIRARTVDGRPLVLPGQPEKSPLWQKVIWNFYGSPNSSLPGEPQMPLEPEHWLTPSQQSVIGRWIAAGAREYKQSANCARRPLIEIDFPSAKECKVCHPRQYEQWSRSMHAYAMHSPIMEAFSLTLNERTSGTLGTFCTRCHTPLGVAMGENGVRRNVNRSRLSMEGITCVVCHRLARPYYKSNTRRAIVPGKLLEGCMFGPFDDAVSADLLSHASAGSAHLKSSAFCGACHDVTSPEGVRLEEAYSEWQNSPAAKKGITCQQCHMGPIQGVPIPDHERPLGRAAEVPGVDPQLLPLRHLSDHTFAGPDYSLLPDTEFPEKLDWMYEVDYRDYGRLTAYQKKTLDALRRRNRRQLRIASQKRYELLKNAARISVSVPSTATAGKRITVRVDVTSTFSGHNFPTGFTAERQAWVEVKVTDPLGNVVFHSGDLDENGDLRDEHSHGVEKGKLPVDRHLLNFQSKFVALTARGTERPVILSVNRHLAPLNIFRPAVGLSASYGRPVVFRVAKGSLPPLSTVGKNYPVRLPNLSGPYAVEVRLNYRHLPPSLFDKIGTPHLKHLLEVVVIDEYRATIDVVPRRSRSSWLPLFTK